MSQSSGENVESELAGLWKRTKKTKQKTNHPLVLSVVLLQPLDPGLALLHAPHVASLAHLLRNLCEDVAVLQAALQGALHRVLPPDV